MAGILATQTAITSTGVAQQLPSNPNNFKSITFYAPTGNTANVTIGSSSAVMASTGYNLVKGGNPLTLVGLNNTNAVWILGTSADVIEYAGAITE